MRSLDLPDEPDDPRRVERADAGGGDRPTLKPREMPDPDERGRAYEAMRAYVSATPAEASPGQRPDPGDQRSYREEVPPFHDTRADQQRRRPGNPHDAADRSGDHPELSVTTAEAAGRIREPERTLSADGHAIEEENKHGDWLEGAEFRLKGEDGLKENVAVESAEEASPSRGRDETNRRSYWDEVPRFLKMKSDLEERWPTDRRPAPDRSDDPPGSYRSDGGFYLNPERHAETIAVIARMQDTEPGISADVRATERENTYGGWLEGFKRRLKGEDRLKEKVAERREGEPDKASAEIVREVPDAIRYTFCVQSESYVEGYYDIKERLGSCGYHMYESRNFWKGAQYKGINTRWVTAEGQRFEVQFHTPESFHAKQHVTHKAYERIRNPLTSDEERVELKDFQREVCAHIQVPNGSRDIPDFKKKGF